MVPSIASSFIDADMLRRLVRRATETRSSTVTTTFQRAYSARRAPPPPLQTVEEMWEEVIDERSGKKYYWNTISDETTGLDAKKPTTFSVIDPTMPVPTMRGDVGAPPPQRTQGRYEDGLSAESRGGGAGSVVGGFGSMIAQGAAWGMGSSLGHRAIGGIFGYGGGGYPTSGGDAAGYPPSGGGDANASSPSSAYDEFDDDFDDGFGSGGDDASIFDFFSED